MPALGAVAVVVAGESTDGGVRGDGAVVHALSRALAHPWLQYMGDISYSLYLAHWPVVVMYPFATGRPVDGVLADGAMVCLVSLALAHASKAVWEDRFRAPAPDKGGCPTQNEGGIPAFARKEADVTIAGVTSDPYGDRIPELSTRSPQPPALQVYLASHCSRGSSAQSASCGPGFGKKRRPSYSCRPCSLDKWTNLSL